jgi:hypothetical protein
MEKEKIFEILNNYKNRSNKDLERVMDFLYEDFEKTKDLILKLTNHLDSTQKTYDKLLDEYNKRTK